MTRFWIFVGLLMAAMLLLFFVGQALHLPFLEDDKQYWLSQERWVAALAGVGLLIADVLAPVPSSIIMFVNGVLFGVVLGSLLSLVGGLGASLVGHWLGASSGTRRARRWMGEASLARAQSFFDRYGMLAVIVSRPIPILAEATAIVAGMSGMRRGRLILASVLGLLPAAVLYAVAGTYAIDLNTGLYAFLSVMVMASLVYLIGRFIIRDKSAKPSRAR